MVLAYAQDQLGCAHPVETISQMIAIVQDMGAGGYAAFALTMIFLQIFPVANAFVLTLCAGAIFGAPAGTAVCLVSSTVSATLSFLLARTFGRELMLESVRHSKEFVAIDKALEEANFETSLMLITLLRASPVLPFTWGNYMCGFSPIKVSTFSLGVLLGCFPTCAAYVYAGQAGADIAVNGPADQNPYLIAFGALATVGGIAMAGNIAQDALREAGLDLSADLE